MDRELIIKEINMSEILCLVSGGYSFRVTHIPSGGEHGGESIECNSIEHHSNAQHEGLTDLSSSVHLQEKIRMLISELTCENTPHHHKKNWIECARALGIKLSFDQQDPS